ncbi:MAG: TolC family protein [Labilithrix sp.]|nr:TolC family protein [Labilithrix sp.]MCW5810882.1 TolC family protein [Labilithrix sp.]
MKRAPIALVLVLVLANARVFAQTTPSGDAPNSPRPGGNSPLEPRPAGDSPLEPRPAGRTTGEPRPGGTAPLEGDGVHGPSRDTPLPRPADAESWRSLPSGPGMVQPGAVPAGSGPRSPSGAPVPRTPGQPATGDEALDLPATPRPVVTLVPPPQANTPLLLSEVLASVSSRFPLLLAEMQSITAADGEQLSAAGSFDPKWRTKASLFPLGYYQYGTVDSYVEQPLYWRGLSVFGGYRIGQGKFPIYYDGYRTNDLGEARAGVLVPLLRGGATDEERAKLWKAEAGVVAAKQGFIATQLDMQRSAAYKYWDWVAAAKKLAIAKQLLDRAVERNTALTMRVQRGDAAAIEITDNARTIVQREQQVVSAERYLTATRLALSLYLRDERGDPVIPSPERVPPDLPEPTPIDAATLERDLSTAMSRRPEMKQYEAKRRQYEVERDLAQNERWPALNVMLAGAKQFGEGYPERQPAALEAGVFLDIPLRTRKADGRARAANARFLEYDLELRYARDKITVEVRDAAAGADAATQRLGLARRELQLARQLEQAERQRFDLGDSNVLFVNIREQGTFEAATRELDALFDHQKALALYRAVLGGPL